MAVPGHAAPPALDYDIQLRLDPAAERFGVEARVTGAPCDNGRVRLYLNRALTLERVSVDGRGVPPQLDAPDAPRFWLSAARPIDLPCPARDAVLSYSGPGKLTPDGRNQVSRDLVELSLYGGWYPMAAIDQKSRWRLRTKLPRDWIWATSGLPTSNRRGGLTIRSRSAGDIVLIASPHFAQRDVGQSKSRVRLVWPRELDGTQTDRAVDMALVAARTVDSLSTLIGAQPKVGLPQPEVIITRRGGSLAYSRLPLVVIQQTSLAKPDGERTRAFNMRHEIAHFWTAAASTRDDWISEALAEFLALRQTRVEDGSDAYDRVRVRYREEIARAGPQMPISATGDDDSLSYLNKYQKGALLFDALERTSDPAGFREFLRATLGSGRPLETGRLLADARRHLGDVQAETLEKCLNARDWPAPCGGR